MIKSLYPIFRDKWSAKGGVFIFSDTHFNDNDCKLMDPNWINPDEQVRRLNRFIGKNDTLILLGDVGDVSYIKKLKAGYKVLLLGNHDRGRTYYEPYFDEVYEGPLIINEKLILSHERLEIPGMINIHGHHHCEEPGLKLGINYVTVNVAADVAKYEPINLGQLIKNGLLATVPSVHRLTIDKATKNSLNLKEVNRN